MSFLGKSLTALGLFEIVAGGAASTVTGDSGAAIAGLSLGFLTLAAGTCIEVEERKQQQQPVPIPVEPSQR